MNHNFILTNLDTDSISFCSSDMSEISPEIFKQYLDEINDFLPEMIKMADDGRYESFVVVAAKNYIMKKNGKVKFKGSSLTDGKKEPALSEMLEEIGLSLLDGLDVEKMISIYKKYVDEIYNLTDIKRWATKKTITKAILECRDNDDVRPNESKVWDAVKHLNPQEGDKVYVYYSQDGMKQEVKKGELQFNKKTGEPKMVPNIILKSLDNYKNDHLIEKLHERIDATFDIFKTIIDKETLKEIKSYEKD